MLIVPVNDFVCLFFFTQEVLTMCPIMIIDVFNLMMVMVNNSIDNAVLITLNF